MAAVTSGIGSLSGMMYPVPVITFVLSSYTLRADSYWSLSCSALVRNGWDAQEGLATHMRDGTNTHPFLFITHISPPLSSKHTLPSGLLLIPKDLPDKVWIAPDGGEEHEVGAEGLLRSIGVLDVRSS